MIRTVLWRTVGWGITVVLLASCVQPLTTREKGALTGAGLGAATGAIIGGATGKPGAGAATGGALGAVGGGLLGDQLQKLEATAASTATARTRTQLGVVGRTPAQKSRSA